MSIRHEHLAYCIPNRLTTGNKLRHAGLQLCNALWRKSLYKGSLKPKEMYFYSKNNAIVSFKRESLVAIKVAKSLST